MFGAAQARGYKKRVHPFVIALLYLVFMIGASVLIGLVPFFPVKTSVALFASAYVSLALAAYMLVIAQKAASYTREVPAKESKLHPFNQYFIAALGFAVFVWNTPVFVEPASRQLEVTLTAEQRAAGVRANELLKEHDQCVANLNARWPSVDESNQADVDAYNKDYDTCEVIRIEQNEAADAYNASIGQ